MEPQPALDTKPLKNAESSKMTAVDLYARLVNMDTCNDDSEDDDDDDDDRSQLQFLVLYSLVETKREARDALFRFDPAGTFYKVQHE
jgi:hypothetical protein